MLPRTAWRDECKGLISVVEQLELRKTSKNQARSAYFSVSKF